MKAILAGNLSPQHAIAFLAVIVGAALIAVVTYDLRREYVAEIARIVHLSPKTVETYRSRLMKKLGVKNVPALVKFAVQHGLTPPA